LSPTAGGDRGKNNSILYHAKTSAEALALLKSSEKRLSSHEAEQRLYTYGLNELKKTKTASRVKIILSQFTSPLIWMLLIAIIIFNI